ncbi:tetratricopeptide repeat protein [Myxococcus xanthus]|uniref:tetratricopeptide repeat protein n=1 Tax=Myxococcus xanthus TaxID=34 RepID=UPI00112BFC02|nr:tetratricopeptide repeat protein [Myxococcus xanthus]
MKSRSVRKHQPWAWFLGLTLLAPDLALSQPSAAPPKETSTSSATFRAYIRAAAQLYEELEYEAALNVLTVARTQAASEGELAEAAIYEAIVLADLGRRHEAIKAFAEALRLNPDAKLPVRVSPKVVKDFETIQGQALAEQAPAQASASPQPSPVITDTPTLPPTDSPTPSLTTATALSAPESPTIPLVEKPTPQQKRSGLKQVPLALVGAGILTGSVGAYLTSRSQNNFDKAHDATGQSQRMTLQETARAQNKGAIVMYTAALAALTGAAITHILDTDE